MPRDRHAPLPRVAAPKVDFPQIMVDLHNAGCTAYRVAEHIGCSTTAAYNWEKGVGEPLYHQGAALLILHKRYCR